MKILILQDDFPPEGRGGASAVAFDFARQFKKDGHEVLVVTTVRSRERSGPSEYEGIRVIRIATSYDLRFQAYVSLWNIPVARQVKKILGEFKPDVVHAHNVHGYLSYRTLTLARSSGASVILTAHDVMSFNYSKLTEFIDPNDLSVPEKFNYRVHALQQLREQRFRYNPLRNILIRRILARDVDTIVAVSGALKQALGDNGIENAQVIHNGIDADEWQEPKESIDRFKGEHGIGESAILFGGRLSGVKGGGQLIKALADIARDVPDVQLLVVGKNEAYTQRMFAQAKDMGVADRIVFTGWIADHELHCAYHASAVVAFPSLCFDTFGLVNIEGMACAKPVVATCFGGSPEIVQDGVSGYIVNPFDTRTLADKIKTPLADRAIAERMGQAGYQRVKSLFTLKKQAEAYERIFE
jgi:glycosyltransferase involved in cell wall biosynthesis